MDLLVVHNPASSRGRVEELNVIVQLLAIAADVPEPILPIAGTRVLADHGRPPRAAVLLRPNDIEHSRRPLETADLRPRLEGRIRNVIRRKHVKFTAGSGS